MKELRIAFSGNNIIVVKEEKRYKITSSEKENHSLVETNDGTKEIKVPFQSFFETNPPLSQLFSS